MPQLLVGNEPWAKALEISLLMYVLLPGNFFNLSPGGINPAIAHSALAGGLYWGYNEYVKSVNGK